MTKRNGKAPKPVMNVKMWPLSRIKPYPNNPRTHPPAQVALLARLMTKYGVDQNIVVREEDGFILKGHGRRLSAIEAGMTHFPVFVKSVPSDEDARAQRIADNAVSLLSGWDYALLSAEATQLKLAGYDMPLLAIDSVSLDWMTGGDLVTNPAAEWAGMPHFNNQEAKAFRSIVVHFKDQAAVDLFAKTVGLKISEKCRFLWFPEIEIKRFTKWVQDESAVSDLHPVAGPVDQQVHGEDAREDGRPVPGDRGAGRA